MPDSIAPTHPQPPARLARRRAFTLLELIVVLVVLGIIALIAIPTFSRIIGGSAERTALTTAQAIARSAQGQASLEGDDATNTYLTRAALEVELPEENLQLAWRAGGAANTGVIGVKATTSGDNNVRFACVFIAPSAPADEARVLAEPAGADGACPASTQGGDINANSVAPSGTLTYTNDIATQVGGGGGASDLVAAIYVCDPTVASGGGAWDDVTITDSSGVVVTENFNSINGQVPGTGAWLSIAPLTAVIPEIQAMTANGSVAGHPDPGAPCTNGGQGGVAAVQVADSGTISIEAVMAAPATGSLMALAIFDLASNTVPTEVIFPTGSGGIGALMRSPNMGAPYAMVPGPFGAGDVIELSYDVAADTTTISRNGNAESIIPL